MNAQSTTMEGCLNDVFEVKKPIVSRNLATHLTLKISTNQGFGTYALDHTVILFNTIPSYYCTEFKETIHE